MKVALELHDFSIVNNRLLWLLELKNYFPNFKVSLFTIPVDEKQDWGPYLLRKDYLKEIKRNLDWIQIIPHGLEHSGSECLNWDYRHTRYKVIPQIEEIFGREQVPFENGFVAPHWRWTDEVVKALNDEGWWGAVDRDKVMPCPRRFYKYNYLLNEPFYESKLDVLKLHGHIYGTKNDVGKCMDNLFKLPVDTEWHFVTDFLEINYD